MQPAQNSQIAFAAAEPIVRFVSKKFAYDDMASSALERATAKRAVEAAAWSVCVMPETADILNDSPVVRAEMLKLLDLEHDELCSGEEPSELMKARLDFAASIRRNPRLFLALSALAPDIAMRVEFLSS
jgi:hypothetical protein